MISFAHPAFLWGLMALSLPVVIHLLSRKEGKVIYLGSLRHLVESNTKQSINIRLNELLLLILRLIVITLLIFYISGVQWQASSEAHRKWIIIEKGLEKNKKYQVVFDSLRKDGFETHFLAQGFPLLSDSSKVKPVTSYWGLIEPIQSRALSQAVVFSFNRLELFRGSRLPLPPTVRWIACDNEPDKFPVQGTRLKGNTAWIRTGYSKETGTHFETSIVRDTGEKYFRFPDDADSVILSPIDTVSILLVISEAFNRDANVLRAALESLHEAFPQTQIHIDSNPTLKKYDWIFQFGQDAQTGVVSNKRVILKENFHDRLFRQSGAGEWILTHRLTEGIALKENLPLQLAQILFPPGEAGSIAARHDKRTMDGKMAWSAGTSESSGTIQATVFTENADAILMTLLAIAILIERIISHHRNQ